MASNGNNNTDISVPVSFLAEMARIVGSTGDYLIFDGTDEAVDYLRGMDWACFADEDDILEWVKDNRDVGDVFESDNITNWVSNYCSPDDVFGEEVLAEWVGDNCEATDVFSTEDIKKAYKHLVFTGDITEDEIKHITTGTPTTPSTQKNFVFECGLKPTITRDDTLKAENEALKEENEALKKKIENYQKNTTHMDRALSDYHLLKNIFGEIVFGNRNAKDGQVWKFNSNEGHGEWC